MSSYYDGLNEKLLAAIPPVSKILELGCANGRLGYQYKQLNAGAHWTGVDISADAVQQAAERLDEAYLLDLDDCRLDTLHDDYDAIVIGDLLEHTKNPQKLLMALRARCKDTAVLVCCVPNMAHISVIERLLSGDLTYDQEGLLDDTHLRFFTPRSIIKNFLDTGWLPRLVDHYDVGSRNVTLRRQLVNAAQSIGVPERTAVSNLFMYQLVFRCSLLQNIEKPSTFPKLSVVIPTTDENQLALNILRSPGLNEINAEIVPVKDAPDPYSALEFGVTKASGDWFIFCHQDVYFPRGSGYRLCRHLASIPAARHADTLIGFAGLAIDPNGSPVQSGLVVDRTSLFDGPVGHNVISIDELAIVVSKGTHHRIDPTLGWHLWATDLCLKAIQEKRNKGIEIVRIPVFHNSYNDFQLSEAFHASASILKRKYPAHSSIKTLCGEIV